MVKQLKLGDISVDVVMKDIKNIHLSVYPPLGRVRIAAPMRMKLDTIRVYATSRIGWIKQQQRKLQGQERESIREYKDRESHYLWGKRYLLIVSEAEQPASVEFKHDRIILHVRPGADEQKKREIFECWYREQIRQVVPGLIEKWSPRIGVKVDRFFVQRMKTMWGGCSPRLNAIRLNTELAKKPQDCLEYIVVHELVHLLEPKHNDRFTALMDKFMPRWQFYRDKLNQLPLSQENWVY